MHSNLTFLTLKEVFFAMSQCSNSQHTTDPVFNRETGIFWMKTDLVFTGFMYSIRQTVISLTWARVVMECVFFWSVTIECVMSAIESPTDHDLWPLPFNISNALQSVNIIPKTPHHIMQTNHRTDFIICFCFFPRHITVVLNSHF